MKKLLLSLSLISSLSFASGFLNGSGGGGGGGSPEIGGAVLSGTQYSILFVDPTGTLAEDPTLFGYNKAANRFCLGCDASAATNTFHLLGTARFESLGTGVAHFNATGVLSSSLIVTADITDANVTNAKLADMAQSTIKGRAAGAGTGVPTDLSATQATAILDNFVGDSGAGGTKGLVPAPGIGDAVNFLRGDGTWAASSGGFADPMTTRGDLIYRNAGNTTARLPVGSFGQILSTDGTDVSWQDGFNSPLTTLGDIIVYNGSDPERLPVGADNEVLTADSAEPLGVKWAVPASGFADPMTTRGDIIVRNASNVTARLAIGGTGTVLKSDGTDVSYGSVSLTADVSGTLPLAAGGTSKALTAADGGIVYSDADSMEILAAGTSGYVLQSNGVAAPSWVAPPAATATYNAYAADQTLTAASNQFVVASGSGTDITLPDCEAGQSGNVVHVKRVDGTNVVNVIVQADDEIDDLTTAVPLLNNLESKTFTCDGSDDWYVF